MAVVSCGRPIVVLGATATGKSAFALALARRLGGELVNFDASCVYRGLDVGTAKPTPEERGQVPHHLLDVCDSRELYSAGRFLRDAEAVLADLAERNVQAVLVGGTGMYLRALLRGLLPSPPRSAEWRERLESREGERPGSLHRILRRLDPATAERVPPGDQYRIVRALEHRLATGKRLSEAQVTWRGMDRLPTLKLGLQLPRDVREVRIRERVSAMLSGGLIEEVAGLLESGVPADAPSFRALGYRDVALHVQGLLTLEETCERMVIATRHYAKRQDTWFRSEPGVQWLPSLHAPAELPSLIDRAMLATQAWSPRDSTESSPAP